MKITNHFITLFVVFCLISSCTKQDLKITENQISGITISEVKAYIDKMLSNPGLQAFSVYKQVSISSFREVVSDGKKYIIGDIEDKFRVDRKGSELFSRKVMFTKKDDQVEAGFVEFFGDYVSDVQLVVSFAKGKLLSPSWRSGDQVNGGVANNVVFYNKDYKRIYGSGRVKTFKRIDNSLSIDPSRFDLVSNSLKGVTSTAGGCETYYVYYITYDVETYEVTSATFLYSYTTGNCTGSDDNASVQPDQGGGYGNIGNDDAEREEAEREYASQIRVTSKPYKNTLVGQIGHNNFTYSWTVADGLGFSIAAHTMIIYDRIYVVTNAQNNYGYGVNDIISNQTATALVGNLPTVAIQWNQMLLVPDITGNRSSAAKLVVNCTGIITFRPLGDLANKLPNISATNVQVANFASFDFR